MDYLYFHYLFIQPAKLKSECDDLSNAYCSIELVSAQMATCQLHHLYLTASKWFLANFRINICLASLADGSL